MSYPYFFISKETADNTLNTANKTKTAEIELLRQDFYHLVKVLRANIGDTVELSDNFSSRFLTELTHIEKDRAVLTVKETKKISKKSPAVFLFQSVLKKEAMELAIQKTAEIGIDTIVPVISSRVVVKISGREVDAKVKRWQQIATEASKQCKRDFECRVLNPVAIKNIDAGSYGLFFAPVEVVPVLGAADKNKNTNTRPEIIKIENITEAFNSIGISGMEKIGYIIGPEGGFEPGELDMLDSKGAILVNFGSDIFRAETAAIYFLSVLDYIIKKAADN